MLYFDEAGYTGAELTNEKQPYFTLSSVSLEDEEIAQIKSDLDYDAWGKEFHFKYVQGSPGSNYAWKGILTSLAEW